MPIIKEPTFNTKLAEILRSKNPRWRTWNVVLAEAGRTLDGGKTPDILINTIVAMPIVVESEFMPANTVEDDATSRLRKVVRDTNKAIEQVIALRVPSNIREVSADKLSESICQSEFEYCLFSAYEDDHLPTRWPENGWLKGGVDELITLIENALISEKLIAEGLAILDRGVTSAADDLLEGTVDKPDVSKKIAALLHQSDGIQTMRMAMMIILNALTFHYILAGSHEIKGIPQMYVAGDKVSILSLLREWEAIVDNVNYFPIFDIARHIVKLFSDASEVAPGIMNSLVKVADDLVSLGITTSHDLYGRVFQRLVTDRKYLATFYTMPESAILLAEIAVPKMGLKFTEHTAPSLRIADFACGTGTLLAAAYHAVLTRHRRAGYDDAKIHKQMMEDALIATDIMPAGVHMTASVLSNVHPTITFTRTKVHTLPYGTDKFFIGALDLLHKQSSYDLLSTRTQLGGNGSQELAVGEIVKSDEVALEHDSCDLVIMNPSFTSPTVHETIDKPVPSFAGFVTSNKEQRAMSKRLKKIVSKIPDHASNGLAGLGSNFIDLAHQKLKAGGVMALVIPSTFAQGVGWAKSRQLFDLYYDDVTIVSLAASGKNSTCFSADTGIAEVLVVAKKHIVRRQSGHTDVRFVSLDKCPSDAVQAAAVAEIIDKSDSAMYAGKDYLGGISDGTLMDGGAVGVLDHELIKAAIALQNNTLKLPGSAKYYALPITKLGDIAQRGVYLMEINGNKANGDARGPFDIEPLRGIPTYPCLWAHNCNAERSFIVQPDAQGRVRKGMQKKADEVWDTRGALHFSMMFRLNSQSITACLTSKDVIG